MLAKVAKPPPLRSAAQWADEERHEPPESPRPGPWQTSFTPYAIPILEACSDPRTRQVTAVTASQLGKTSMLLSVIGHRFHDGPRMPCLFVLPTQKLARSMSADRVARMLRECQALDELHLKGKKDSTFEKWIAGVPLRFAWAGSATELAAHPSGLILMDEVSRYDGDVGGEGDPIALARARCKNYATPLLFVTSSPTVEDACRVQSQFDTGSMEFWQLRCVHCGEYHRPLGEYLTWPEGCTPMVAELEATYACPHCGSVISESERMQGIDAGRMWPYTRDRDGDYYANPTADVLDPIHRSFWVSGLCSRWVPFSAMARALCSAYRSREPEVVQGIINTWLGEMWRVRGDAPQWEDVARHRSAYKAGTLPYGVQTVTCGVDVQRDRLYYVVRGWGNQAGPSESWLIEHGELHGRTDVDDVWVSLGQLLRRPELQIRRCFIDSGYKPSSDFWKRPDHRVYAFCRRLPHQAFPTKGYDNRENPVDSKLIEYTDSGGRRIANGIRLWRVATDYWKSWVYDRVGVHDDDDDAVVADLWHLPDQVSEDYCRQVCAEELLTKASGRQVWQAKPTRPNHYLDCEVLAAAAAWSLNVQQLQPLGQPEPERAQPAPRRASGRFERRGI